MPVGNTWYCIPSARPPAEAEACLSKWRERGYKIAVWRDEVDQLIHTADYFVGGIDGIDYPDPNHTADEIAAQCSIYFDAKDRITWAGEQVGEPFNFPSEDALVKYAKGYVDPGVVRLHRQGRAHTFGVVQPTGDRFAGGSIDRICGSPWIGRSFAERVNGGKGPLWPEYTHMFGDEELQEVATKLGVLWQRPDLTHYHKHFQRVAGTDIAQPLAPPPHLVEANSPAHWAKYQALFRARKAAGFPGSEVIA